MEMEYQLDEVNEAAATLLQWTNGAKVLTFSGEMGAGKTTLIAAICRALNIEGSVSSPTFSIINEYRTASGPVYHIDLYRCRDEEEAIRAGVEDCLYSGVRCLVEWPSKAPGIIPASAVHISIRETDHLTRKIYTD